MGCSRGVVEERSLQGGVVEECVEVAGGFVFEEVREPGGVEWRDGGGARGCWLLILVGVALTAGEL